MKIITSSTRATIILATTTMPPAILITTILSLATTTILALQDLRVFLFPHRSRSHRLLLLLLLQLLYNSHRHYQFLLQIKYLLSSNLLLSILEKKAKSS